MLTEEILLEEVGEMHGKLEIGKWVVRRGGDCSWMDRKGEPDTEHHGKGLDLVLQVMRLLRDPILEEMRDWNQSTKLEDYSEHSSLMWSGWWFSWWQWERKEKHKFESYLKAKISRQDEILWRRQRGRLSKKRQSSFLVLAAMNLPDASFLIGCIHVY